MKNKLTAARSCTVSLLFALGLNAQAQLLNETFDTSSGFTVTDGNDVAASLFSDGANDYFGIFDGAGDGGADFGAATTNPTGTPSYTGFDDNYLVNEDMDADGAVLPFTLTWDSITLSGETLLEISADFASTRADAADYIVVSYRVDGGAWIEILGVAGEPGFNGPVFEITDFSAQVGDTSATAITSAFTNISSSFTLAGTEATLEVKAEFFNDNGDDNFGMDNLVVQAASPPNVSAPTDLNAAAAAVPDNKGSITVDFTQNGDADSVLIVYNTEEAFGAAVDGISYLPGDTLVGGGTVAGVFSSAPATIAGLAPGTTYLFIAYSVNSSDEYSIATSSTSASTDTFALQVGSFSNWTAIDVLGEDTWGINGNFADANGFDLFDGGTNPEEDWLISPEFNLDNFVGETFEFDYSSQFVDPAAVGLELFYTTAYTGDPTTTSWVAFTGINGDFDTNKSIDNSQTNAFSVSADLGSISGTTVRLGFKYITGGTEEDARTWNLSDPLVSGNGVSEDIITLSSTLAGVDEGQSQTVTLSVPTIVGNDTDFFLSSNGDGSELSFPGTVTIPNGSNSVDFTVNGLTDGALDGDNAVDLIANSSGFVVGSLSIIVNDIETLIPAGAIVITQYSEGSGNNKYIELTNVSGSPVDMTGYALVRWGNTRAEEYKTATEVPADEYDSLDLSPLGILVAGQTVVIANSGATEPVASGDAALTQGFPGAITFNGNDSVVIYSSSTPNPANIVDAIGFTNTGFEGSNTSFVRASTFLGYDLTSASNATSPQFASVWTQIDTASVDAAAFGDDAFLGSTDLATPPAAVSFNSGSQIVSESAGSFDLEIGVTNLTTGTVVVEVSFNAGSSAADTGDITFSSPQLVTFDAASLVNPQTITVPIVDDGLDGSIVEVASFDLSISSGSAILVAPDSQDISIQDADVVVPNLIISEVTDPSDTANAKYVEIYNPGSSAVNLSDGSWTLARYANANVVAADDALTGTIAPGGTYIVANNATDFALYGSDPADQIGGAISGNGDDTYALFFGGGSSTGILVDIYGAIGTDGTGEAWEYTNSRAYRNTDEITPSSVWNASEWTIEGAAVADMSPGVHPEGSTGPVLPLYPITEDFSGTSTWVNQAVGSSGFPWLIDAVDERAEADGFADGAEVVNNYLVSPAFDFTSVTNITLSFDYGEAFDGPDLELLYSTNYSGSGDPEAGGVVWVPVSFVFVDSSDSASFSASSSGDIALPGSLEGQTDVYFAFKYTADGTDTGSEQWYVDNIVVDASSTANPLADYLTSRSLNATQLLIDTTGNGFTVIEEYFAGFADGLGPDAIVYGVDPDGPAFTLTSDLATDPAGVVVALLATSDLTAGFTAVAFTIISVDNGDGTFTRSYTETNPPAGATSRFYQLQLTAE